MPLFHGIQLGPNRNTAALAAIPLLLTTLGVSAYRLYNSQIAFPLQPNRIRIHPGLASLPKSCRSWEVYPEDILGDEGGYASLPFGRTKYWLLGPVDGVKVTFISGLSIPAIIWKDVALQLAARGFRVLVYDLYGRGYSDAPELTYDLALYITQLALLLQYLKWDKTNLVGLSMGGAIAVAFVDAFPHLVSSHVGLVAAAGILEPSDLGLMLKVLSSPFFMSYGNWYIQYRMKKLIDAKPTADLSPITEIIRLQSALLPYYNRSVSSSVRSDSVSGLQSRFKSSQWEKNGIAPNEPKQVLFIHGTKDATVPYSKLAQMQALLPAKCREQSKCVTVEGAGHDLTISKTDIVGNELVAFLLGEKVEE